MKRTILFIATISIIILFSGCGSGEEQVKEKIRPVKSMTIGDIGDPTGKGFPGTTKETKESEMSFRVSGNIIKYKVVEGAQVKKGTLIAEIDPRDYKVTVQSTEARYNQTKAESDRYYRLWKKGSVAKNDYERRFANSLEAEAAWEDAKNALIDTKLFAPYTAFYGPKLVNLGEEVTPNQAITTLVDLSVIEVRTTIPEQLAVQFASFESYEVQLETYPDKVFKATLKELEKKPTSEGYPLHLILDHINKPGNSDKVTAGMSCRVTIVMKKSEDEKGKIIIPLTAVFESVSDDQTAVWIINTENNTVKRQNVVIGDLVGNDAIQIDEGLATGQQIVVAGVHRLTEGDRIKILESN